MLQNKKINKKIKKTKPKKKKRKNKTKIIFKTHINVNDERSRNESLAIAESLLNFRSLIGEENGVCEKLDKYKPKTKISPFFFKKKKRLQGCQREKSIKNANGNVTECAPVEQSEVLMV